MPGMTLTRGWYRNGHGTWVRSENPWWRLLPAKATSVLVERHLLPRALYGLHEAALRWRGPVKGRYLIG